MPRTADLTKPSGAVWGPYPSTAERPNVAGSATQTDHLSMGDLVTVVSGADVEVYACTKPALGAATYSEVPLAGGAISSLSLSSTLAVTGTSTLTGGIVATAPLKVWNHVPLGALNTRGTDAARTAGTIYYAEIAVPSNKSIAAIACLNGTTVGTDKVIYGLYSEAGVLLRSTALAGTLGAGSDVYQRIALTSAYSAVGPAKYLVGVQIEGTTHCIQCHTTLGPLPITGSQAGVFGTMATISSVATTHTDNVGPMVYLD